MIVEGRFEWDAEKATPNFRDHGVAFDEAVAAFRDPFGVERVDDREDYGEERINLLGMCGGVILHVTYTERGDWSRGTSAGRVSKTSSEA